jgi:hypothetical protein
MKIPNFSVLFQQGIRVKVLCLCVILIAVFQACSGKRDYEKLFKDPIHFSKAVNAVTDVITFDIFNPPIASRIYAYASLAAYEVMVAGAAGDYRSLSAELGMNAIPKPDKPVNFELASTLAYLNVGQALTFSKDSTQKQIDHLLVLAEQEEMPDELLQASVAYARQVADSIMKFSKGDNYAQTRTAVKYTVKSNTEGRWVPTPPAYMKAVEPQWMKIRPIMLDSAAQFLPEPPPVFSKDTSSRFYKMAHEVYEAGNSLKEEQNQIADFWDCNGFKLHLSGHVMFGTKAMTPGGHWMGITGIICGNEKADFNKTVYTYMGVSFALMDGFISCWSTKFSHNLLRPETYINLYIDKTWKPYLQTPPFPEYSSGHSVISSASATVLTSLYGDQVAFTDTTERRWGWPDRTYKSVNDAAKEAAMSRFYGGIHFKEAIDNGMVEGKQVGDLIVGKLKALKK